MVWSGWTHRPFPAEISLMYVSNPKGRRQEKKKEKRRGW